MLSGLKFIATKKKESTDPEPRNTQKRNENIENDSTIDDTTKDDIVGPIPFQKNGLYIQPSENVGEDIPLELRVGDGGHRWRRRAELRRKEMNNERNVPSSAPTDKRPFKSSLESPNANYATMDPFFSKFANSQGRGGASWKKSKYNTGGRATHNRSQESSNFDVMDQFRMLRNVPDEMKSSASCEVFEDPDMGNVASSVVDESSYECSNLTNQDAKPSCGSEFSEGSEGVDADSNYLMSEAIRAQLRGDLETYNKFYSLSIQKQNADVAEVERGGNRVLPEGLNSVPQSRNPIVSRDDILELQEPFRTKRKGKKQDTLIIAEDDGSYVTVENTPKTLTDLVNETIRDAKLERSKINALNKNEQKCHFCLESDLFARIRRGTIISMSSNCYVSYQTFKQLCVEDHLLIVPISHFPSIASLEEDVYEDIYKFQTSLVNFYKSRGLSPVFVEIVRKLSNFETRLLGGGLHAVIECLPVPSDRLKEAKSYFWKALNECGSDWSNHKRVIDTSNYRGPKRAIPKNFKYIHVDFGAEGSMAHIIENNEVPSNFARDIIRGLLEIDRLQTTFQNKQEYFAALENTRTGFCQFDWTKLSGTS